MTEFSTVKMTIHGVTQVALSGPQDPERNCMARKLCIQHKHAVTGAAEWVEITLYDFDGEVRVADYKSDDLP